MTTRTFTHPQSGPVDLAATSRSADIHIRLTDTQRATVTISTPATSGPAADAVRDATLRSNASTLTATVRDKGIGTVVGGITASRISVFVDGNVGGAIHAGRGRVYVNGHEVTGGGATGQDERIRIDAELPHGSRINATTVSAGVIADGRADTVHADTTSGDITITETKTAELSSVSGAIHLDAAQSAWVNTTSGAIKVKRVGAISADSTSGDIRIGEISGNASLDTVSGDITAGYSGPREPTTRTVTGRIRVRRVGNTVHDAVPPRWGGGPRDAEPEDAVPPGFPPRRPR